MMNSDIELTNLIDAYLRGELTNSELTAFEQMRETDPSFDIKVVEHHNFIMNLSEYGKRQKLSSDMNSIHESIDVQSIREEVMP